MEDLSSSSQGVLSSGDNRRQSQRQGSYTCIQVRGASKRGQFWAPGKKDKRAFMEKGGCGALLARIYMDVCSFATCIIKMTEKEKVKQGYLTCLAEGSSASLPCR